MNHEGAKFTKEEEEGRMRRLGDEVEPLRWHTKGNLRILNFSLNYLNYWTVNFTITGK